MESSRLARYAQLLQKGAAEFQRQIQDGLARKKEAISQLQSSVQNKGRIASGLVPIAELDLALTQRVYRWIKSRDEKYAFNAIKEITQAARGIPLVKDAQRVLELSDRKDGLINDLLKNCQSQLKTLQKAEGDFTADLVIPFQKLVNGEERILKNLRDGSQESKSIFVRLSHLYRSTLSRVAASGVAALGISQIAGAQDLYDPINPVGILNPANPHSPYNPASPFNPNNSSSPLNPKNLSNPPGNSGEVTLLIITLSIAFPFLVIFLVENYSKLRLRERLKRILKRL
ncbi:hypothetical protein HYU13_05495 [Candidatus Woesearchaeota archaeon]|nr:hypothetical protein [Candidatus Woesearchaeota archaeon]